MAFNREALFSTGQDSSPIRSMVWSNVDAYSQLRIIASIEEPAVIARILAHLQRTAPEQYEPLLPLGARAPPAQPRLL
jgi:hypothetical protein